MRRVLFLSTLGLTTGISRGKILEEDLVTALYFLDMSRDEIFNRHSVETTLDLQRHGFGRWSYHENREPLLHGLRTPIDAKLQETLVLAETQGRVRYHVHTEKRTCRGLNEFLELNGESRLLFKQWNESLERTDFVGMVLKHAQKENHRLRVFIWQWADEKVVP